MTTTNTAPETLTLKSFRFGVELETVGLGNQAAARVIAAALGGTVVVEGGYYNKITVKLADGRKWTAMNDSSLRDDLGRGCSEIVSPILTWADMAMLATVCDTLKAAGASVNTSCGMHVHVDGAKLGAKALANLATVVWSRDALITAALGIESRRMGPYCKNTPESVVKALRNADTKEQAASAWYSTLFDNNGNRRTDHYHGSRYHGLNLHSYFYRGTVEFRWFAGTVDATTARANVVLCLALAAFAANATSTRMDRFVYSAETAKTDMFRWLSLRLKVNGAEFSDVRASLCASLPGVMDTAGYKLTAAREAVRAQRAARRATRAA